MIPQSRRLLANLLADRTHPPLERLARIEDPERFVWAILPHVARTFSFCIALLPSTTARALAVAYLYCRMLDTCEDLPAGIDAKRAGLRAFLDRFARHERGNGAGWIEPPAPLAAELAADAGERVYVLLLQRASLVDRVFLALPAPQRALILRLVRRMGEGMVWAVETLHAQGGALRDEGELSRYCFEVLGQPLLFAEEMQRLERGLSPEVPPGRLRFAAAAGEAIQLANITRDLEKDCARGVYYLPELAAAGEGGRAAATAAARRRLLARALLCGRSLRPYMSGIPSPRFSLARGAGLLMTLFTLAFWQGTAETLGLTLHAPRDRLTPRRSIALVVRAVLSRRSCDAILARIDRLFAEGLARLSSPPPFFGVASEQIPSVVGSSISERAPGRGGSSGTGIEAGGGTLRRAPREEGGTDRTMPRGTRSPA